MRALLVLLLLATSVLVGCSETAERSERGSSEPATPAQTTAAPDTEATPARATGDAQHSTVIIEASGGERVEVWVEVADNPVSRSIGLRGREHLPENRGMLFVFTREDRLTFTMEDTLVPLSIAFIDSGGRIVDIQDMRPQTTGYVSAEPARYALEVNRGFFEKRGVEVGNRVELPV